MSLVAAQSMPQNRTMMYTFLASRSLSITRNNPTLSKKLPSTSRSSAGYRKPNKRQCGTGTGATPMPYVSRLGK